MPVFLFLYVQVPLDTPLIVLQILGAGQQIPVWQLPPVQLVPLDLLVTAPVLALKFWHSVKLAGAVHVPFWQVPLPQVVPLLLLLSVPVDALQLWQIPGVDGAVQTPLWHVP